MRDGRQTDGALLPLKCVLLKYHISEIDMYLGVCFYTMYGCTNTADFMTSLLHNYFQRFLFNCVQRLWHFLHLPRYPIVSISRRTNVLSVAQYPQIPLLCLQNFKGRFYCSFNGSKRVNFFGVKFFKIVKMVKGAVITPNKRSLGQGNIFTPVCHSVHRGRGASSRGGWCFLRGVVLPRGGAW